ncbi:TVP38/TMEM64 family protein [Synechococcus sp. R55.3]|uniref:TVP38/TMEM64 family protein n=1 Tax=unclassified Synechococcus TaxID=2626047 RepID=UPI0039C05EDE
MEELPQPSTNPQKQRILLKLAAVLGSAIFIFWAAHRLGFFGVIQDWLTGALAWMESLGPLGPILFIAIYIVATVLLLPASVLTLGAGAVFGVVAGTVYVLIGATIGANLAFFIGRYLAREQVAKWIEGNAKFAAIDRAVGREGWKIVGLIRLSPAFPFNVLNYALGLTRISFLDNLLGTAGIVPGTFMYVYIGSLAGSLANMEGRELDPQAQTAQWVVRLVGLIATVAATLYVTRVARQALQEAVEPV